MTQNPELYRLVGGLVKKARDKAGFTQDVLATKVGLTRTSITNIEQGRQKILLHTLYELASALGTKPAKLLPDLKAMTHHSEPALEEIAKGRPKIEREWIKLFATTPKKDS